MGVVYKALDTRLSRFAALKFLPEDVAQDPQAIERFRREARTASSLNHPNICTIYDIGESDGRPFIAMELLEGQTLKHRISKRSLPPSEFLDVAMQIASGLEAAHAKGIIHRDVKSSNIFLVDHGPAKILDFGLAKLTAYRQPSAAPSADSSEPTQVFFLEQEALTNQGQSLGTIAYMSPEQARGQDLDARSDLFSLGVVLYEMATGVLPFHAHAIGMVFDNILHASVTSPTRINGALPPNLDHILAKALEKDPDLRYQTASELRADLKRLQRDLDSGQHAASTPSPLAAPGKHLVARQPRTWRTWAAIVAAVAAIIAIFGYILTPPAAPPRILRTLQLTNTNRPKSDLVTDGSRLYFIEGQSVLSQISVNGGETFRINTSLEDTGFANVFDISPDGSDLLMNTALGTAKDGPLWTVPVIGGAPRRLGNLEGHCGAWSRDRTRIAFCKGGDIFVANSDAGDSHRLLATAGTPDNLRWSPDDSILRFTLDDPQTNGRSIWQVSADGSNLRALFPGWNNTPNECCGKWTPDGGYFVFQATRDGTASVWALRERRGLLSGRQEPTQLTTGPMNVGAPVPSRDGKKLFVQGWQPRGELVRYDTKSGRLVPYLSGLSAMGLDFSRDRQWVAYNDATDGTLWRSKLDGSQKLQLVLPPMLAYLPRWSPDGKQIAFFGHPPGEPWHLYSIPIEGGAPELLYKSADNLADPSWSPDGKSLAFGENSLNNQGSAVYVLDLKSRNVSKLAGSDGLYSPRWSPDGRFIAAIPLDSLRLMLFDLSAQKWSQLAKIFVAYPVWSRDSHYLYFNGLQNNEEGYYRVQVADGKLERLFSMKGFQAANGAFGNWSGLAPDESPLLVRDASVQELYTLEWDRP